MTEVVRVRKKPIIQRQRPVTTSDIIGLNADVTDEPTDLHLVKQVSQKLNLATRRPSTVQWKQVIEFRKSQGFYSSDVEPEFLDRIVGAKLNKEQNSLGNGGVINPDDVANNNVKTKTLTKDKKSKKTKERSESKKNGFVLPGFSHKKDKNTPKKEKSKRGKEKPEIEPKETPSDPLPQALPNSKIVEIDSNKPKNSHCDVIIPESEGDKKPQTNEQICRFPLYDTDDEGDDVTAGMSETAKRYRNITRALGKIRRDLITMRIEDNKLARKLLDARSEINLIRVHQSCDAHAEMLDDVTYELEEEDMLPGLIKACDLPSREPGSLMSAFSPLRNMGLSRMNLNRRRFSIR